MRRRHKYNAKRTTIDGITFDSKAEARRYTQLKLLERAGTIRELELQPKFELQQKYQSGSGKNIRGIFYVADFLYIDTETGKTVIEDVKGRKTAVYNLKKKIFEKLYHPLTITEIRN